MKTEPTLQKCKKIINVVLCKLSFGVTIVLSGITEEAQ